VSASADRVLLPTWYAPLLGGLVPILLLGFLASAVADRLAFAGWGLAVAFLWTVLLRQSLEMGWSGGRRWGALALLAAGGLAAFAALEVRHGEALDLGLRAVFSPIHHPALARPATALVLAALFAAAGAIALVRDRTRTRLERADAPAERA
jgi:hypothetical protein